MKEKEQAKRDKNQEEEKAEEIAVEEVYDRKKKKKKDQQKQTLQILDGFPRKRATTDGTPEIKQRQNRSLGDAAVIRVAVGAASAAAAAAFTAPPTLTPILSSAFF